MKPNKNSSTPLQGPDDSGTLLVLDLTTVDATTRKMLSRIEELDGEISKLHKERRNIIATLASIGYRPPQANLNTFTATEIEYRNQKPFRNMSLTDACLKVLRNQAKRHELDEQWLDKNQIEYLLVRGGYEFKAEDSINSVHVTLRRLRMSGLCQESKGKGSRPSKYHFLKDREQ